MKLSLAPIFVFGILTFSVLSIPTAAQTCAEPKAADFKATALNVDGLSDPVHLSVVYDGRVFLAEMQSGTIKVYDPATSQMSEVGTIPVRHDFEEGLLGIATPPDFDKSHFLYAYYTFKDDVNRAHVLSRYTVTNNKLDMGSQVEVLRVNRYKDGRFHSGGGMVFDSKGNLWLSAGDDTKPADGPNAGYGPIFFRDLGYDAQKSASNTNDLRGKILRIHPEPTQIAGKWYTVPQGNFKDTYASQYSVVDQAKILPEIYTMGMRNPYRFTVDNQTGWLIWGEVGPDSRDDDPNRGLRGKDEFNVATKPGFYGWPYCNGNQFAYNNMDYSSADPSQWKSLAKFDCANPENHSPNNTGVIKLPPSQAPIIWYDGDAASDFKEMGTGSASALGGPMYRYSKTMVSKTKFPPQYDGRIFIWDWMRQVHKLLTLDENGKLKKLADFPVLMNGNKVYELGGSISAQYGPDGSLYVLKYSDHGFGDHTSGLTRIDYTGAIDDACAPVVAIGNRNLKSSSENNSINNLGINSVQMISGLHFVTLPENAKGFILFNAQGKKVWEYFEVTDLSRRVALPNNLFNKVLRLKYL